MYGLDAIKICSAICVSLPDFPIRDTVANFMLNIYQSFNITLTPNSRFHTTYKNKLKLAYIIYIYLGFYVDFNTVQVLCAQSFNITLTPNSRFHTTYQKINKKLVKIIYIFGLLCHFQYCTGARFTKGLKSWPNLS